MKITFLPGFLPKVFNDQVFVSHVCCLSANYQKSTYYRTKTWFFCNPLIKSNGSVGSGSQSQSKPCFVAFCTEKCTKVHDSLHVLWNCKNFGAFECNQ